MNKLILNSIFKKLENKNNKLLVSSLSFQAILAIIPTIISTSMILNFFDISIPENFSFLLILINKSWIPNSLVFLFSFYIISKLFYSILKVNYSFKKAIIFSAFSSLLTIAFLIAFFLTYILKNNLITILAKTSITFIFAFSIFEIFGRSSFKYNVIFSVLFSIISTTFIYIFSLVFFFFIEYEKYYGFLSPIFISIILVHYLIYIALTFYICSEEFTKFSKIKFIKS